VLLKGSSAAITSPTDFLGKEYLGAFQFLECTLPSLKSLIAFLPSKHAGVLIVIVVFLVEV